jgi:fumarate hydratase class II
MNPVDGQKPKHFSFDVYSTGSSTIKNLSLNNQPIANAVLRSLNVIDAEEADA